MNNIKSLFTMLLLTTVTMLAGQVDKNVVVTPVKGKQAINVYVDLGGEMPYTVSLRNDQGEKIWSEQWKKPEYAKSVLMDKLPEGEYAISVEGNSRYMERNFTLGAEMVSVNKGQRTILGPTVSVMNRSVLVDFDVNRGEPVNHKDVDVQIFAEEGAEVFANSITTDHGRITRYDMSLLPNGQYDMLFSIEGKTFTRSVRIK